MSTLSVFSYFVVLNSSLGKYGFRDSVGRIALENKQSRLHVLTPLKFGEEEESTYGD